MIYLMLELIPQVQRKDSNGFLFHRSLCFSCLKLKTWTTLSICMHGCTFREVQSKMEQLVIKSGNQVCLMTASLPFFGFSLCQASLKVIKSNNWTQQVNGIGGCYQETHIPYLDIWFMSESNLGWTWRMSKAGSSCRSNELEFQVVYQLNTLVPSARKTGLQLSTEQ